MENVLLNCNVENSPDSSENPFSRQFEFLAFCEEYREQEKKIVTNSWIKLLKIKTKRSFYTKIIGLRHISIIASPGKVYAENLENIPNSCTVFPVGFCWRFVDKSRSVYRSILIRNCTINAFYSYDFSPI